MKYTLKTAPTALAVSVADVKQHLRIESYGDHDAMVQTYIESATKSLEQKANLCLKPQTWTAYFEQSEVVERLFIYKYPITAISSIKYYDSDNVLQTISSGDYTAIFSLRPSEIIFDDTPSVYDRSDALQIEFVAGFTTVPDDIILALKQRCYKVYNNPDDFVEMKQTYFDKVIRDYRSYEK
jgi:uncharacterized phiE125 gp8 family phage protein